MVRLMRAISIPFDGCPKYETRFAALHAAGCPWHRRPGGPDQRPRHRCRAGLPLPGAIVSVPDTTLGAVTDTEGRYTLTLPPGTWALEFSFIGFATQEPAPLVVLADSTLTLHIALQHRAISLSEIIVTPGRFAIMGDVTGSRQTLSEEEIQTIPQFGETSFAP